MKTSLFKMYHNDAITPVMIIIKHDEAISRNAICRAMHAQRYSNKYTISTMEDEYTFPKDRPVYTFDSIEDLLITMPKITLTRNIEKKTTFTEIVDILTSFESNSTRIWKDKGEYDGMKRMFIQYPDKKDDVVKHIIGLQLSLAIRDTHFTLKEGANNCFYIEDENDELEILPGTKKIAIVVKHDIITILPETIK